MASHREAIEAELQRCMVELKNMKPRDQELSKLEAEIFGKHTLGSLANSGDSYDGKCAYYVREDGDIDLRRLSGLHSCLSGNLYGSASKPIDDTSISISTKTKTFDGTEYKMIIHSTKNKDSEVKICSISIFDAKFDNFLAYLFTTNDPLAFDNFNCFRNGATASEAPRGSCVEQMVFCNNKVQVAKKCLEGKDTNTLYDSICNNYVSWDLIVEMTGMDKSIAKSMEKNKDAQKNYIKSWNDEMKETFFANYSTFLARSACQTSNLPPKDAYQKVGKMVFLDKKYVNEWDRIALLCVISARMKCLEESQHERRLVAAMIPSCVIECSKFDDKWAFKIPNTPEAMQWLLTDEGFAAMIVTVKQQIKYQDAFIYFLKTQLEKKHYNAVVDMLCSPKNLMLLGLSERIIQSVWKGEIAINNTLKARIDEELVQYGIKFQRYDPVLRKSQYSSYEVASAIGQRKRTADDMDPELYAE